MPTVTPALALAEYAATFFRWQHENEAGVGSASIQKEKVFHNSIIEPMDPRYLHAGMTIESVNGRRRDDDLPLAVIPA